MKQRIIEGKASYTGLGEVFASLEIKKYMLVYTNSAKGLPAWEYIEGIDAGRVLFNDFTPNPKYEEVEKGVRIFREEGCDAIIAFGGGSAIDVAKCIKLYCKMEGDEIYLKQPYADSGVPLIAIPTTAGTGSESTPFSVIYLNGEKQSVKHPSILPDVAVLDPDVLDGLPVYQKKCTVLDAYCQAIEAWWSVHSTIESKAYSKAAIEKIRAYISEYVKENTEKSREEIMAASNLAGKAIAVTATTAPHAMGYKLTTTYGYPHGHSVALCLPRVWKFMLSHPERCTDRRGAEYLFKTFEDIAEAMGYSGKDSARTAAEGFEAMLNDFGICYPEEKDVDAVAKYFADAVNVDRLGNNPVSLDNESLFNLYKGMFIK